MTLSQHVFLVGFMGAGKSTVGALVAERLGVLCIDLDRVIEAHAHTSIAELFATLGEEAFRDLETAALLALADAEPSVVACGGGIVLRPENRAALKRLGRVVYLEVSAGEALARVGDTDTRPLLAGSAGALAATTLLAAREGLYRSVADATVVTSGRTPDDVAEHVIAIAEGEAL